ncbi:MAG: sugar transferase [Actinobacteria bacterium]|nr:sugar transferase [Actinomycetota bacterium]
MPEATFPVTQSLIGVPTAEQLMGGAASWSRLVKRSLDIGLSSLVLAVLLPLVVVLALVVRLDSPGPVLFRQRRVGAGGRGFMMLKFRSMHDGAEALRGLLEKANEADGPLFKVAHDPRITRFGAWLRRFSLDEIPQFVNVLRGEMSLVGPRPALPSEVETYDLRTSRRLMVQPGLTGPWQVSDRHLSSFEDYVRLDLDYVDGWSVVGDLVLLARTVPAVLRHTGV